ncbi:flagellar basal-body rod protein FlgF [Halobacteriovorax sp. XZX-3]|uniref:flagellar basal-body rod protein FlgF n=1 Tax=unclassified Halobacteriovorax TaxID=2639665 RepID=UPI000CD1A1FB|nr:flagellar basal-body rod protein FlgF [Halobacteriovorax sp. DA5]POB13311.1 flagellar basal-body rod protein FlgF [Halobacteriovorax sp. DA5]
MKELWVPLSGAIAQQQKVDTIANNVANANTPGFKKDQLAFKEYLTALDKGVEDIDLPNKEWAPEDFYRSYGAEHAMVKVDGSFTNFTQGTLSPTSNPLDIGLRGNGFLAIETPKGVRYTRRGTLSLRQDGVITTQQGYPVLNREDNQPISVPPGTRNITFALDGAVYANNNQVGSLNIAEFNDMHALRKEGNSLYINNNEGNLKEQINTSVHQGFIEQSNVNAVSEMSELIKAHRHFESIQKAIKTYDQISSKSVNEMIKF